MKRLSALLLFFLAILALPAAASAELKPLDDPTIVEGLRDKGVDWLKETEHARDADAGLPVAYEMRPLAETALALRT